jgi:hypothetical protein
MKTLCLVAGLMVTATRAAHIVPAPALPSPSLSGNVASLPYDFSEVKEPTLFRLLSSTDDWVRLCAFAALERRWKAQMKKGAAEKEKGPKEELDEEMKTLFGFLENKTDRDDAIMAARVLAFTPPGRAHHTVVTKHLQTAVTGAKEIMVRARSAEALRHLFWARGEALDEESVKATNKFLRECRDPGALNWLLWGMSGMGSDCLPFKATLEKIRSTADPQSAARANSLLDNLDKKMDAAERKEIEFMPRPN